MASQRADRRRIGVDQITGHAFLNNAWGKLGFAGSAAEGVEIASQEPTGVSSSGDRREIVDMAKPARFGQRLENTEGKRRAPDALAGEGQAQCVRWQAERRRFGVVAAFSRVVLRFQGLESQEPRASVGGVGCFKCLVQVRSPRAWSACFSMGSAPPPLDAPRSFRPRPAP